MSNPNSNQKPEHINQKIQKLNDFAFSGYRLPVTGYRDLVVRVLVICCFLLIGVFYGNARSMDLEKIKVSFLAGDYDTTITQGEKLLSITREDSPGLDELYYIMGLSYLKQGHYLRSSDIFQIILNEFKNSKFTDEARMGLGDSYFLTGDYPAAEGNYKQILKDSPKTTVRPLVYYRLSQCAAKTGDTQAAADYLNKLRLDAPLSLEVKSELVPEASAAAQPAASQAVSAPAPEAGAPPEIYYTVQVGNFSRKNNAENLKNKLVQKGYPAYMEESSIRGKPSYCVRVGKAKERQQVLELEKKLTRAGYPTKIFP